MKNCKRIVPILLAFTLLAGCAVSGEVPSGTAPAADQSPTAGQTPPVSEPPAPSQSPVASEPPVVSEPPVTSQPPVVSEPPVTSQPPVVSEPPVTSQPPVVSEPPVTSQPPVVSQPPVTSQPPVVSQPPVTSQPPVVSEPPVISEPPIVSEPVVTGQPPAEPPLFTDPVSMPEEVELGNEAISLSSSPLAIHDLLLPEASGVLVKKNSEVTLDYSNSADGYIMVCYTAQTDKNLRVRVVGPNNEDPYQYNLTPGEWTVLPFSDGDGAYTIKVYRNTTGSKYAVVLSHALTVTLKDEFAPFLRPNQYVDYAVAEKSLAKAEELVRDVTDPLAKVEKIYTFVVHGLTYDKEKAKSVQSGYLPVLDDVLEKKTGICFDYAALMTGMLRSQGVPCKLVVGYAGTAYHAWISVWTEEYGWIDSVIYFDGSTWHRMDPTYASSASRSNAKKAGETMEFIGDGTNYKEKYLY